MKLEALLCVAFLLQGCSSSVKVATEFDAGADFGSYRTWAWVSDVDPTSDPRIDNIDTRARIQRVIEREMAVRGFTLSEDPDFLVNYHAALSQDLNVQSVNDGYGEGAVQNSGRWMSETTTYDWQEGTLILDFLDAETKALSWRGSAQAKINLSAEVEEREAKVADAVRKILERFPPKNEGGESP